MIVEISGKCQYENCDKDATCIACGRETFNVTNPSHPTPACYCAAHAAEVSDERFPEYTVNCPNCNCIFGAN